MAINWEETAGELAALVRAHDVAYEVTTEQRASNAHRPLAHVGYRLRLVGSPLDNHGPIAPGCPRCQETFRALVRIANAVLPDEQRPTRYELGPFDAAWHLSAVRAHGIELSIVLLGRRDASEPEEDCQRLCRQEIEARLGELDVLPVDVHAGRTASRDQITPLLECWGPRLTFGGHDARAAANEAVGSKRKSSVDDVR